MAKHILRCNKCERFTMIEECKCAGKAVPITPPKYSPDDKYAGYRRQVKRPELERKDFL